MTKGLPASGKTTWAKELLEKEPYKWKRINKDDLRSMLDNGKWSDDNEKIIITIRDNMIAWVLLKGLNVIIDDTNLHPKHEVKIRKIVETFSESVLPEEVLFELKDFTDVPVETCLERDYKREGKARVGAKVIRKMHKQFIQKDVVKIPHNPILPDAVLCDIDGTLALFGDKNPYQRDFINDTVNQPIKEILESFPPTTIRILVSGRSNEFLQETVKWLKKNEIGFNWIYMPRNKDDNRKDTIIKQEIYDNFIKDKFNVKFVLDDRDQVVELWRSLGLTCLQVAEGDF